jgi:hypothetical protein
LLYARTKRLKSISGSVLRVQESGNILNTANSYPVLTNLPHNCRSSCCQFSIWRIKLQHYRPMSLQTYLNFLIPGRHSSVAGSGVSSIKSSLYLMKQIVVALSSSFSHPTGRASARAQHQLYSKPCSNDILSGSAGIGTASAKLKRLRTAMIVKRILKVWYAD